MMHVLPRYVHNIPCPAPAAPKAEGKGSEGGGDLTATTFPLEEEVAGLHFAKLVGRRPTLIGEFAKLRHNLKEEADTASGTNMKVLIS